MRTPEDYRVSLHNNFSKFSELINKCEPFLKTVIIAQNNEVDYDKADRKLTKFLNKNDPNEQLGDRIIVDHQTAIAIGGATIMASLANIIKLEQKQLQALQEEKAAEANLVA